MIKISKIDDILQISDPHALSNNKVIISGENLIVKKSRKTCSDIRGEIVIEMDG